MGALGIALMLAQIATPADIPKKPLYTEDGQKVVCRQIWEVYSRIPTRVCRTEAQWEEMAKQNEDDWRSSRNSRGVGCNSVSCI